MSAGISDQLSFLYSDNDMGGDGRYPYPKQVWSPAGGWWVRPSNWKSNTFIVAAGIAGICYMVGNLSASKEHRYIEPAKAIPSAMWSKRVQAEKKDS
ncbi:hypothetical protein FB446DRAFT_739753 [Lentinula raphanica]|nr:hypothetical protein FB446DRAFT_739753 [Lentinula raphanica]